MTSMAVNTSPLVSKGILQPRLFTTQHQLYIEAENTAIPVHCVGCSTRAM